MWMIRLCVFVAPLKDNSQVRARAGVPPRRVSRPEPICSDGFLQKEVGTSGAWVFASGSKNLAQPGALHKNHRSIIFELACPFSVEVSVQYDFSEIRVIYLTIII